MMSPERGLRISRMSPLYSSGHRSPKIRQMSQVYRRNSLRPLSLPMKRQVTTFRQTPALPRQGQMAHQAAEQVHPDCIHTAEWMQSEQLPQISLLYRSSSDLLIFRNENLHSAPCNYIGYSAEAEHNHISGFLSFESEERKRRTGILGICKEDTGTFVDHE